MQTTLLKLPVIFAALFIIAIIIYEQETHLFLLVSLILIHTVVSCSGVLTDSVICAAAEVWGKTKARARPRLALKERSD